MEKIGRNDPCWCGSGKKYKKCHCEFDDIIREHELKGEIVPPRSIIKNKEQIAGFIRIKNIAFDSPASGADLPRVDSVAFRTDPAVFFMPASSAEVLRVFDPANQA